ncbi:cardiolipin synthase [Novosphingobium sp.]|uniref:cardiolipin synthase n=1 Tax=Novosphingobium sp. TaxID=1874826 RepID=UPI003D09615A
MHFAFGMVSVLIDLVVVVRAILLKDREPVARAAWVLLIIVLPGIGAVMYLFFGEPWVSRRFRRQSDGIYKDLLKCASSVARSDCVDALDGPFRNAFKTCEGISQWQTAPGNVARVAQDSDTAITMIVDDINQAQRTVHLSFYIWLTDNNGLRVVDAVCAAARRGVHCRVVTDAIGSRNFIRSKHWAAMRDAGASLCASLKVPFGLAFLTGHRVDLRNHRKIVVIDGQITYCGSQNCADPAFLVKKKYAPWVDIMIRYQGPIVWQAEVIFASDWSVETGEDLRDLIRQTDPKPIGGGFDAITTGTGPLSSKGAMSEIFVSAISAARHSIVVSTPYFAPDTTLLTALVGAGRRGVAVRMIFPHRNDSRAVGSISRAYYPELAEAGVQIFEYQGGLLHAKTLVADDEVGLVGSANMDRRSLDLNFENNVLFSSADLCRDVSAHQQRWLEASIEIKRDLITRRSVIREFGDNLLTMVAPLF